MHFCGIRGQPCDFFHLYKEEQVSMLTQTFTVKHLYFNGGYFLFGAFGGKKKLSKYETAKYNFKFSYTISNKWTRLLSMLVSTSSKANFYMVGYVSR